MHYYTSMISDTAQPVYQQKIKKTGHQRHPVFIYIVIKTYQNLT